MNYHPDLFHCQALKARWKWPTVACFFYGELHYLPTPFVRSEGIPCPSIGELLEQLSDDEIIRYIFAHNDMKHLMGATLMRMVLTTVRDSNALADIWLWAQKEEV